MLGIRFETVNEYNVFLKKIFDGLDIDCFNWKIAENEILFDNRKVDFNNRWYDSQELKKNFFSNNYYLIFLNLQGFFEKDEKEINNYDDFLNSNCEIIILFSDSVFGEIYCKSEKVLNKIHENLQKNNFKNVHLIFTIDSCKELSAY